MVSFKERCIEAIRQEALKEFKDQLFSRGGNYGDYCYLNPESGKYRLTDVEISITEDSIYDEDGWGGDFTSISAIVVLENLKGTRKYRCRYDLF